MNRRLLTKPLRDHLVGLQRKIDRLDETTITKAITDSIQHVLIETGQLDWEAINDLSY